MHSRYILLALTVLAAGCGDTAALGTKLDAGRSSGDTGESDDLAGVSSADARGARDAGDRPADASPGRPDTPAPVGDASGDLQRPPRELGPGSDGGELDASDASIDARPDSFGDAGDVTDAVPRPPECPPPGSSEEVLLGGGFLGEARCGPFAFFAIAAAGMRLHLSARRLPVGAEVVVSDPTGAELARQAADERGVVSFDIHPVRSGEVRWSVVTLPESPAGRFQGSLICLEGCEREGTRYPVVLLHGICGTDRYFGLLDYFHEVPGVLADHGYAAYTPVVDFIGPSEARAADLAPQIDEILTETGAAKVHLIAHSQGGLDLRVLVSGLGYADRVASATTVSTPHTGLPIDIPDWLSGQDFSRAGMADFGARFPDVEGLPMFSWAGHSCGALDFDCQDAHQGEVVDVLLAATHLLLKNAGADDGDAGANDGVAPVSSARWGAFLGELPADHWDEIGQVADGAPNPFDHRGFYLGEARRLRQLELDHGL